MNKISTNLITAILTVVLGIMLLLFKDTVIDIAMTVIGVGLIVWAVFDFLDKNPSSAIVKAIVGVVIIVLGWLITDIVLYVLAGILLAYAVYEIYLLIKAKRKTWEAFVQPILFAVIAVLFFLKGFDWSFIVAGVILIIQGAVALFDCIKK